MVNYSLGKVYRIEPITVGEEGDVYIGSTSLPMLSTRMANHRNTYKFWKRGKGLYMTSYSLFEKYGVENCKIVLLESVNAANKDELSAREGYWIRNTNCVNKIIVGRTMREWKIDNREHIKQYDEANKERRQKYFEEYYKTLCKIQCECDGSYFQHHKKRHINSVQHQKYLASL